MFYEVVGFRRTAGTSKKTNKDYSGYIVFSNLLRTASPVTLLNSVSFLISWAMYPRLGNLSGFSIMRMGI